MLLATALMVSGCTISSGGSYQVDLVPLGYHFHIYQLASAQVWLYNGVICAGNTSCTLAFVGTQADINGVVNFITGARPESFFDDDVDDFTGALFGEVVPANASINDPGRFGCLSGYRNTQLYWNDGDWYGTPYNGDYCRMGEKVAM